VHHLDREIEKLKKSILEVGTIVEESLRYAMQSLLTRNAEPAKRVIHTDPTVDIREVLVEEECLKILALYQPVAYQLRFVIAVLKINNDLERIGDLAVNIAQRSLDLLKYPPLEYPVDFKRMAGIVEEMLAKSLDALVNRDSAMAVKVCILDDEVDQMHRDSYPAVAKIITEHPEQTESLLHLLSVSRYLERCADQVTNIAEDVIYLVEGSIVRHKHKHESSNNEE